MNVFETGKIIKLLDGSSARVVRLIGEGGSAYIYAVEHKGKPYVLKWFKHAEVHNCKGLYQCIKTKVDAGKPCGLFVWPISLTVMSDGSFGYVMECISFNYLSLHDYLRGLWSFTSYRALVEACIQIVSALAALHLHGFYSQAFDEGNILVDPRTGAILVCDADGIIPAGTDASFLGTLRYIAPELVAPEILGADPDGSIRKVSPSTSTDYWLLAVVLFMILCMGHPLEGERWLATLPTLQNERLLYGTGATFVYDPNDDSNRLNVKVHENVAAHWDPLPIYMKEAFLHAFSKDAIRSPDQRLHEIDWMRMLGRFQAEIKRCQKCGGEVFMDNATDTPCDVCGEVQYAEHCLRFRDYAVTASKGVRIYRCMFGSCNVLDAFTHVGTIISHPSRPGLYFLNNTSMTLECKTPKGTAKPIAPNSIIPLSSGIVVSAFSSSFAIE